MSLRRAVALFLAAIALAACSSELPTTPALTSTGGSVLISENAWGADGGALVANPGEGQPDITCNFQGFESTRGTSVQSPNGNTTLSCHFADLPPIPKQETLKNWTCGINNGGVTLTRQSQWVRSPSGSAQLTCHFSGKPFNDAAVGHNGIGVAAQQGAFTAPLTDLAGQRLSGEAVDVGLACTGGDPLAADPAGKIALIERGTCSFADKITNAMNAGAIGAIVYNSVGGGELITTMGGSPTVGIPGVFVARSTGLAIQAAGPSPVVITHCGRSASCRGAL